MKIYYQARNKRLFIDSVPVAMYDASYFEEPHIDTVLRCFEEEEWEVKEGGRWIFDPVPPKADSTSFAHDRWVDRIVQVLNMGMSINSVYFDYDNSNKKIRLKTIGGDNEG